MFDHPPTGSARRDWLKVWALVALIYSIVPFARRFQAWFAGLFGREAFTYTVYAVVAACAAWAVVWWLRRRKTVSPRSVVVLGLVLGVYAAQAWTLDVSPEEAWHLLYYGLLSLLLFRALSHTVRDAAIYLSATLAAAIVGIGDELIQWITPRRFWGFNDVGLNAMAAALMQVGIALGLRPAWIARKIEPASAALAARLAVALVAALLAVTSNTPPRMAWLREQVPLEAIRRIDDIMIEYGHCFRHPEAGRVKSRLREHELVAFDAAHAAETAAELDRFAGHSGYDRFFRAHTAYASPFLYEARVRLFRRDFHIRAAMKNRRNTEALRNHATIVYREQQILDTYFSNTVAASGYRLPPEIIPSIAPLVKYEEAYRTPVSESLICAFTEAQLRAALLGALLAAVFAAAYYGRKASVALSKGAA
jgi:VanZ family protein